VVTDSYAYWREKLAGYDPEPPTDRTQMPCGFWRMRDNRPLAVWMDGAERVAMAGSGGNRRRMAVHYMESIAESGRS